MSPTRTAAPKRRRVPRAEREAQILVAAEQVFAERGYQATTMEDVADRVGVTKPLIYEYFGSKEGLLSACIVRARTQLREASEASWAAVGPDAELVDVFRAGVLAFFEFIDEHRNAFLLIQQEGAMASQASPLVESIREQQSVATARTLGGAPGLGDVPPELLEGCAEVIVGACERVAVWRLRRPGMTAEEATELVVSTVWSGLDTLLSRQASTRAAG